MMVNGKRNLNLTSRRLEIFPQMKDYDVMASGKPVQYAMLSGPPHYSSERIHTDALGFRFTHNYKMTDLEKYDQVNLVIGGSTVFGVGATSDATTIPGYLASATNEVWLNLGLRGGNSFQEIIHLIQNLHLAKKIKNIVVFSGVNDNYVDILKPEDNHWDRQFNEIPLELYAVSPLRQFACLLLAWFKKTSPENLVHLSLKEMFSFKAENFKTQFARNKKRSLNNILRNFFLYSALKTHCSGKLLFVLQPFASWSKKELSDEEKAVFSELESLQAGSAWLDVKKILESEANYQETLHFFNQAAQKYNVKFVDSNPSYNKNQTYFVDAVHLTDAGNKLASDIILGHL